MKKAENRDPSNRHLGNPGFIITSDLSAFWNCSVSDLFLKLQSSPAGLSEQDARKRKAHQKIKIKNPFAGEVLLFLKQFKSPLVLILIAAVILSSALADYTNSLIILIMILLSGALGFWQERKASKAIQKLREIVQVKTTVRRNGTEKEIPIDEVVPGDIVLLTAGNIIPADCFIIESNDIHVNEATLTGESFPAEKEACTLPADTTLNKRKNCLFEGTSVVNGTGTALVIHTGENTEFGKIAEDLERQHPETSFETGIKKFGYMLMQITLVFSMLILSLNIILDKPVVDSILFALALAVGMAPELLPAIVTITLSAGAKRLVEKKVIVKRLSSIQNLGAIDVLCSDKTGTLTEGIVKVQATVDLHGKDSKLVYTYAYLNAAFETGFKNPLDEAIRNLPNVKLNEFVKFDEVPYDFVRKRLSVVVGMGDRHIMITKGAVKKILEVCDKATVDNHAIQLTEFKEQAIDKYKEYSSQGLRTIGICFKDVTGDPVINKDDEVNMTFLGFILLSDPPKPGIIDDLNQLNAAGVNVKLITGDNQLVAAHLSRQIGLKTQAVLTGSDLKTMSDEALVKKVDEVNVFAETEPYQKDRIVQALRKAGHIVGFIGDGINDVSAMKAADVGISVDTAVDVAKETADIVLLDKDLGVLKDGIYEGRTTFMNTMKYIFITISANFGNIVSVAGASLFLPFLPMLPKQILLINLLTDLPAMAITSDSVDKDVIATPKKWNTTLIRKFMVAFGLQSSLFDFLTFSLLLWVFQANVEHFRTGWFVESVITEVVILLVIRTQLPLLKSKPGKALKYAAVLVVALACLIPYLPYTESMGFSALPFSIIMGMLSVAVLYCLASLLLKKIFFKKIKYD